MQSSFVFTQWDRTENLTKPDSVGLFSYNMYVHALVGALSSTLGVDHAGPDFRFGAQILP